MCRPHVCWDAFIAVLGHVQPESCRLDMFDKEWESLSVGGWPVDSSSGFSYIEELGMGTLLASHSREVTYTVLNS